MRFCDEWDQTSFDPEYDTLPLEHFIPMLERVMGRAPFGGLPDLVPEPEIEAEMEPELEKGMDRQASAR